MGASYAGRGDGWAPPVCGSLAGWSCDVTGPEGGVLMSRSFRLLSGRRLGPAMCCLWRRLLSGACLSITLPVFFLAITFARCYTSILFAWHGNLAGRAAVPVAGLHVFFACVLSHVACSANNHQCHDMTSHASWSSWTQNALPAPYLGISFAVD